MKVQAKVQESREQGQSLVIISLAMVALLALLALVVDAGNNYAQRRITQNAADAGALAGALTMADDNATNTQVWQAATKAVIANGVEAGANTKNITVTYVVQDTNQNYIVVGTDVRNYGATNAWPKSLPPTPGAPALPVRGVQVQDEKGFPTFIAKIISQNDLLVHGVAVGYVDPKSGSCSGTDLFPLTINQGHYFPDLDNNGTPDVDYSKEYTLLGDVAGPGQFQWLTWDGSSSAQTLLDDVTYPKSPTPSGLWNVGDEVPGSTGFSNSSAIRDNIALWAAPNAPPVTIPVYNTTNGKTGNNLKYIIAGFARFKITSFKWDNSKKEDRYIKGQFIKWVSPNAQGGCTNFGTTTVSLNDNGPGSKNRRLIGTVRIQQLTPSKFANTGKYVPVDVVHVMDISGSMKDMMGNKQKVEVAKDALLAFNTFMQFTVNGQPADQVGLVTFPKDMGTVKQYQTKCGGKSDAYQLAETRSTLTGLSTTIDAAIKGMKADGGTPLVSGIEEGYKVLTGPSHKPTNLSVMIVASDGIANFTKDGRFVGVNGQTQAELDCLAPLSAKDAIDAANVAKSDGNKDGKPDVIIFSIAIGNDFNPATMQAIATSNKHFYTATDPNSMQQIYQTISQQIQNGAKGCTPIATEAFGANAALVITNKDTGQTFNLTADSTGQFAIENAAPGTYEIKSASTTVNGVVYNVFTSGVGGPVLNTNPIVKVLTAATTYSTDVALKTTTDVCQ